MTFFSHCSKRPVQLGMFFALLCTTLILPPSMLPDLVSKNTTAQACGGPIVPPSPGIGGTPDPRQLQDSDGDELPDCLDPCPYDPENKCNDEDLESTSETLLAIKKAAETVTCTAAGVTVVGAGGVTYLAGSISPDLKESGQGLMALGAIIIFACYVAED